MTTKKMRVSIPINPEELLNLSQKVYDKHLADKENSLLNSLQDYSWSVDGPNIAVAKKFHQDAEKLKGQMESLYKQRDMEITKVKATLLASRDLLTGAYRANMKKLTDWGFEINDSPKPTRQPKVKPV